jgi:hypothetical protein
MGANHRYTGLHFLRSQRVMAHGYTGHIGDGVAQPLRQVAYVGQQMTRHHETTLLLLVNFRVQCIAQAIAQQVESQHRHKNRQAGK